ncbi:hypothetical protein HDV62DRAFT_226664 [Trichoderma sp. SZMC 28011]
MSVARLMSLITLHRCSSHRLCRCHSTIGLTTRKFSSYKVSQLHSLEMCDDIWWHALKSASEQVTPHLHVCLTHAHAPSSEHDIPPVDRCRLHIAVDTLCHAEFGQGNGRMG